MDELYHPPHALLDASGAPVPPREKHDAISRWRARHDCRAEGGHWLHGGICCQCGMIPTHDQVAQEAY